MRIWELLLLFSIRQTSSEELLLICANCPASTKPAVTRLEVDQVLKQFNLDFSNVAVVVTDGAANMKAAFK